MWGEFDILDEDLSGFKFADDVVKPDEQECSAAWTRMRTQSALVVCTNAGLRFSPLCDWCVGHIG